MELKVDFWQLVGLAITIGAAFAAIGKALLLQTQRQLEARFEQIEQEAAEERLQWQRVERALQENFVALRERVARIEATGGQAPSHGDLGDLHDRINGLSDQVGNLTGEFVATRRTLEMLQQFLLHGGKS